MPVAQNADRLIGIACGQDAEPLFGQDPNEDIAYCAIILDEEYGDKPSHALADPTYSFATTFGVWFLGCEL